MSQMLFDQAGKRFYHTGVRNLALYVIAGTGDSKPTAPTIGTQTLTQSLYQAGVPWDGITNVTNSPSGGDETELWADDMKYGSLRAAEKSGGTIECYQFPKEFYPCDGMVVMNNTVVGQQARKKFGFCYLTTIGNDQSGDAGEILHIVYNASTSPSEHQDSTVNDSPSAGTFSYGYSADSVAYTKPAYVNVLKPVSTLQIPTTMFENGKNDPRYINLKAVLYGRNADATATPEITAIDPQLPSPDDIMDLLAEPNG